MPWITLQIKNKVSSRSSGEDIWNSSELGQSFAGRSERLVCQSVLVIRAEHHHELSAVGEGDGDHGDQHSKLVRVGELLQVGVERKLVLLLP